MICVAVGWCGDGVGDKWHYQLGVPEKLRNIRSFVMVQGEMGSA